MAAIFQIRRGSGSVESLMDGELYVNKGPDSLQYSVDERTITLAKLDELNTGSLYLHGGISASGDITASNMYVSGNVTLGGTITIGDSTSDNVVFNADLSSSIIPDGNKIYDLGNDSRWYRNGYIETISASFISGAIAGIGSLEIFSQSVDNRLDYLEASSSLYDNAMSGSKRLYVSPEGIDTNDGKDPSTPFKTIKAAVESLGAAVYTNSNRYTIFVGSGEYTEQNPIAVPPGVAIVGDTLRTVRLTASNPTQDFFHVHDSNYFYGLRFLDLQHPAFAFSFPSSTATSIISGDSVDTIDIDYSVTGYTDGTNQDLGIIIEGPNAGGTTATATADVVGGIITQINVTNGGTGYGATEKPHISIPAPLAKRPVITTSPYVQNCSSITGPFNTSGVKVLQALPYDEATYNIDEQGAGGGIRIDGNLVHPFSPLESFVADAFTQVNQGGPGHLVINKGYAQFVSCFTTFCTYGFKTANGGFANISNSVIDFGKQGLVSKTYFPTTYNTGSALETKTSQVSGFVIDENGAGYTGSIAGVIITGGGASVQATAEATVNANGSIDEIVLLTGGSGYTSQPSVTIDTPTGPGAILATTVAGKALISGVTEMLMSLEVGLRGVDISSNMILNGVDYLVTDVAEVSGQPNQRRVTTYPAPPSIQTGDDIKFHQLSNISTGGLVMEYVGSGVTYNALPKYGGVPIRTREIIEFAPGRVFYSTVDNIGNLKIGDFFSVNQLTGEVTIDANSFNLSGLNAIGPFRRNGVAVGVVLQEVSNNTTLLNSQGLFGEDTTPTQYAVKEYVQAINTSLDARLDKLEIASASLNTFSSSALVRLSNLEITSASHNSRLSNLETKSASVDVSLAEIHSYTSSLKTAIDVNGQNLIVLGDLTVNGTTTQINSTQVNIGDNILELNFGGSEVEAGIYTKDATGASTISGSLLWDSNVDYWKAGIKGIESKILLAGGDGVLSGSTDFSAFSASVDSRLTNLQLKSASVDISISNINSTTESLNNSVSLLNSYTASNSIAIAALNQHSASLNIWSGSINSFSGNVNTRFDNLQTYTTSVNSRLTNLESKSASVDVSISNLNLYTASANVWSGTIDDRFTTLQQLTQSVLQYTASANVWSGTIDNKFTTLASYTGSVNADLTSIHQTTASLNIFSASINYFSSSTFTDFSNSYDAVSESFDYRISILDPGNISASIGGLNTFTSSATIRLHNLELFTSSIIDDTFEEIASSTHTLVSGSSQVIGILSDLNSFTSSINTTIKTKLDSDGVISSSIQILGGSTIHSSSVGDYQFNSIGVGTTASTTAGEIRATGDITAYYSSDIRLKENVTPIPNALEKVNQISGNTYDWKEGYDGVHSHKGNDVGVIAQEIEQILPQIVTNRDSGFKAVQYEKIIPLLIEAVKELSAKVDRLENK